MEKTRMEKKKRRKKNSCKIWLETKQTLRLQDILIQRQELKEVFVEGKDRWPQYSLILETYLDYDFELILEEEIVYHIQVFPRNQK
jgi:hypothetical protein